VDVGVVAPLQAQAMVACSLLGKEAQDRGNTGMIGEKKESSGWVNFPGDLG
jgi:hypothetical protein